MKTIYLTGAPASGKTTLGRRLAATLKVPFVDLDEAIVNETRRTIPEIFATDGETAFRAIESDALRRAEAGVVALGGGTLLSDANRAFCESHGAVFCLETPSDEELARRLGAAKGTRPLGDKAKERAAHYASFPNRIAGWFDLGDSLVIVGQGIAPSVLASRRVVADQTVADLWRARLDLNLISTIPSGESYKTISTVASLWRAFAKSGLGRSDIVTALGGGVTGDLMGFAAATWMRGIDWINVPTTLLSMVDASTGGKTGCDLPEGKNLAGAFHSPRLVVIDIDFLATLPPEILRAGRAEMIKHEIIDARRAAVSSIPSAREIYDNLAVKVGIVREDPFETKGRRLLLNCGHTVGHAIEKATNYALTHGEAVAIGCVEEAKIAVRRGLAPATWPDELAKAFHAVGLPTTCGLIEKPNGLEALKGIMKGDKKRAGAVVTFALPCGWGDVRAVPIDLDKEAL